MSKEKQIDQNRAGYSKQRNRRVGEDERCCGMTFKQFKAWCNERACDGCWSFNVVTFCIEIIKDVKKQPFWRREKHWQKLNEMFDIENKVVNHINAKIEELEKEGGHNE
jgi:hypothetical protein